MRTKGCPALLRRLCPAGPHGPPEGTAAADPDGGAPEEVPLVAEEAEADAEAEAEEEEAEVEEEEREEEVEEAVLERVRPTRDTAGFASPDGGKARGDGAAARGGVAVRTLRREAESSSSVALVGTGGMRVA